MTELTGQTQTTLNAVDVMAWIASALGVEWAGGTQLPHIPRAIEPTAVYDEDAASAVTATSYETRYRAVKGGKLTCRRVGSRRLYLGSDLLIWLENTAGGKGKNKKGGHGQ